MNTQTAGDYQLWKCANCGSLVPYGGTHACPNPTYWSSQWTYGTGYIDQETKDLLKRIADALEIIAGKQK